jgi:hypothetical protein
MLLALVVLLGVVVFTLLLIWLTGKIFVNQVAIPVEMVDLGTGTGPLDSGMEIAGPTEEEIGSESDLEERALQDTLAAISDAVGDKQAVLDDPAISDALAGGGGSRGQGRMPGDRSTSGDGESRNWGFVFRKGKTLNEYARQLDFFDIELGVLMPDNKLVYVTDLAEKKPATRSGPANADNRYRFVWQGGDLQKADRELLSKAGVDSEGRIVVQFITPEWEAKLATMEKNQAASKADRIGRTRFAIKRDGSGYAFYILEQTYK